MTDRLDARIRRVCAEMVAQAAFKAMNSQPVGSQSRIALSVLCYELNEIAQASAEASGDGGVEGHALPDGETLQQDRHDPPACSVQGEAGIEPGPSPSDPFAPMVDAFVRAWFGANAHPNERREDVRRALAAAIEKAPLTDAMIGAWADSRASGVNAAWRVFNRALAAELRDKP